MHRRTSRLKGLMVILASILLALTVSSVFYYFKIKQNESYQNQLHFRELNDINKTINNGIGQLKNFANISNSTYPKISKLKQIDLQIKSDLENYLKVHKKNEKQLKAKNNQLNKLNKNINQASRYQQADKDQLSGLDEKINSNTNTKKTKQNELAEYEQKASAIEDKFLNAMEAILQPFLVEDEFISQLDEECESDDEQCKWAVNATNSLLELILDVDYELPKYVSNTALIEEKFNGIEGVLVSEYNESIKREAEKTTEVSNEFVLQNKRFIAKSVGKKVIGFISASAEDVSQSFLKPLVTKQELKQLSQTYGELVNQKTLLKRQAKIVKVQQLEQSQQSEPIQIKSKKRAGTNKLVSEYLIYDFYQSVLAHQAYLTYSTRKKDIFSILLSQLKEAIPVFQQDFISLVKLNKKMVALTRTIDEINTVIKQSQKDKSKIKQSELTKTAPNLAGKKKAYRKEINSLTDEMVQNKKQLSALIFKHLDKQQELRGFNKYAAKKITAKSHSFGKGDAMPPRSYTKFLAYQACIYQVMEVKQKVSACKLPLIEFDAQNLAKEGTALKNVNLQTGTFGSKDVGLELDKINHNFELYFDNGAATAPIDDFLGEASKRFPLTLLVDSKGKRIATSENLTLNASLVGLSFEHVDQILVQLVKSQKPKAKQSKSQVNVENNHQLSVIQQDEQIGKGSTPGYSGFVDIDVSGVSYRLFVSPIVIKDLKSKIDNIKGSGEVLYLIGFKENSQLTSAKLSISRSLILLVILVFVGLVALVPLFKIRLVSVKQSFSIFDRHFAVIGLLLLITVLTIGLFDFIKYEQTKNNITKQSRSIFIQIRNRFDQELSVLSLFADNVFSNNYDKRKAAEDYIFQEKPLFMKDYFLESLFYLSGEDDLVKKSTLGEMAFWSTSKAARNGNYDISLKNREYVKRAYVNDLWPVKVNTATSQENKSNYVKKESLYHCQKGLFAERLFNLRDSRLTTQFSLACKDKAAELESNSKYYDVLSFGTKLQTFFQPILPANFGFVVFDNKTGLAIYHSDDKSRSLVENVFAATDNNRLIKAMNNTPYFYNQPINFDAIYNGKMHNFSIGALKEGVPWTLAIFYDKQEIRSINLIATFISLTLCFALILVFYLFLIGIFPRHKRRQWFWPSAKTDKTVNTNKTDQAKWIVMSLVFVLIVFVLGVSHYVFNHHYMRYQQIINAELANSIVQSHQEQNKYRQLVIEKNSAFTREIKERLPCYLGTKLQGNSVLAEMHPCSVPIAYLTLDKHAQGKIDYFALVVEYFWEFIDLRSDIDDSLIITKKLNRTSAKIPVKSGEVDNNLNLYSNRATLFSEPLYPQIKQAPLGLVLLCLFLIIFSVSLLFAIFYVIIKRWLFGRLIGFNIQTHFRQNEKFSYSLAQLINDKYFEDNRFVQVIRPSQTLTTSIFTQYQDTLFSTSPLVKSDTTNVSSFYDELLNPEMALKRFLTRHNIVTPLIGKRTLILSGLEGVAVDIKKRRFALDIIEQLMSIKGLNIILLCEVAPLYHMTQQAQYPCKEGEEALANPAEIIRWSDILRKFTKVYDWSAPAKYQLIKLSRLEKFLLLLAKKRGINQAEVAKEIQYNAVVERLLYESKGWPELEGVWQQFWQYNEAVKGECSTEIKAMLEADFEGQIQRLKSDKTLRDFISKHWQSEQIEEYFGANAGAFYRFRWELCTRDERLLMYQIANGFEPNSYNREPIDHLTRRGYIFRDRGWHIINNSFKHFILSAESEEVIELWGEYANESIWRYLRIPFFALLIALLAIMAYAATDAIESALGILTAVFALIPMAIRNFSLFKGG